MPIIVAPTEPVALRKLGRVSLVPETMGCDVLVIAGGKKVGVQRKEIGDLLGSLDDGRLAMQLAQMSTAALDARVVLVEGEIAWSRDGTLLGTWSGRGGRAWTRKQIVSVQWSLAAEGVWWVECRGLEDTCAWVAETEAWWAKGVDAHRGIRGRPAAPSAWGKARNVEWAAWVLQGWPGIGAELARRIVQEYGLPVQWTVSAEELSKVKGISRERAAKIIATTETMKGTTT